MTGVVDLQIRAALGSAGPIGKLVVAYEPVWAIGTGLLHFPRM
jgi:triosephosphate isomerase